MLPLVIINWLVINILILYKTNRNWNIDGRFILKFSEVLLLLALSKIDYTMESKITTMAEIFINTIVNDTKVW